MQILEDILSEEQGSGWQAFMHDEFLSKFIARFVIAYHVTKLCDAEATNVDFLFPIYMSCIRVSDGL